MISDNKRDNKDTFVIKVVFYENDNTYISGLKFELNIENDIKLIFSTADKQQLLNYIQNQNPNIAIIDLSIYGDHKAGIDVIKEIKRTYSDVKCLVLTSYATLKNFILAFDSGVEGFAEKGSSTQPAIPDLIRLLNIGGRYYDPQMIDEMRKIIDNTKIEMDENQEKFENNPLTLREQEILDLIGSRLSDAQIAKKLNLSEHTIKSHLSHIYGKLDIHGRIQAYQFALINGWLKNPNI